MLQKNCVDNAFEISLIKYDQIGETIEPLQYPLMIDNINTVWSGHNALSDDFLVCTVTYLENVKIDVFIYHHQDPTDTFIYLQCINASEYLEYTSQHYNQLQLVLDKDVLSLNVPQSNRTLIFFCKMTIGSILFHWMKF